MSDYVWVVMMIVGFMLGWFFNENFHIDFTKNPKVAAAVDAYNKKKEKEEKKNECKD